MNPSSGKNNSPKLGALNDLPALALNERYFLGETIIPSLGENPTSVVVSSCWVDQTSSLTTGLTSSSSSKNVISSLANAL